MWFSVPVPPPGETVKTERSQNYVSFCRLCLALPTPALPSSALANPAKSSPAKPSPAKPSPAQPNNHDHCLSWAELGSADQARLELDDLTGAASDLATAISLRGSDPALLRLRRRLQSVSRERQATAEGFASGGAAGGEQSQDASPGDSGESVEGESGEEQSGEGESIDRSDESDDDDESGEEEAAVAAPSGSFRFNFDHS